MKIHHTALWVKDIEKIKDFYCQYFDGQAGARYENAAKGFASYFLHFGGGSSLEVMARTGISARSTEEMLGYCHVAFAFDSPEEVDGLSGRLQADGYLVLGQARTTGDGYYESVVADPEGNRVELVFDARMLHNKE